MCIKINKNSKNNSEKFQKNCNVFRIFFLFRRDYGKNKAGYKGVRGQKKFQEIYAIAHVKLNKWNHFSNISRNIRIIKILSDYGVGAWA